MPDISQLIHNLADLGLQNDHFADMMCPERGRNGHHM